MELIENTMVVLVNSTTGKIINEEEQVTVVFDGRVGTYTGWMPPHPRNEEGLAYVRFEGKSWDESFLPSYLGCKLIKL